MDKLKQNENLGKYMEIITPYFLELFRNAPPFGSCGIEITFHNGLIANVEVRSRILKLLAEKECTD